MSKMGGEVEEMVEPMAEERRSLVQIGNSPFILPPTSSLLSGKLKDDRGGLSDVLSEC